jgi:hypothetical protein
VADRVMGAYPGYRLADVWRLTLRQVRLLMARYEERRAADLQTGFAGYRVAQHGDERQFKNFLSGLGPRPKIDKRKRGRRTKSG